MRIVLLLLLSLPIAAQDEIVETLGAYQHEFAFNEFTGRESVNFHFTRHSFPGTDSTAYYLRVFVLNPNRIQETALFNAPYQDIYVNREALQTLMEFLKIGPTLALREHATTYWKDIAEGFRVGITVFPKGRQRFHLRFFGAEFSHAVNPGRKEDYARLKRALAPMLQQWPERK